MLRPFIRQRNVNYLIEEPAVIDYLLLLIIHMSYHTYLGRI